FKACPERSNESAPSALTISKNAVTHSIDTERGLPYHSAKARRSGGMQAQRLNAMRVTRIYGASEKNGRKELKRQRNYHRRSLAETQVCRFKTVFGDRLQTRQTDNQFKELMLKSAILNRMTHLGIPDSVKIAG